MQNIFLLFILVAFTIKDYNCICNIFNYNVGYMFSFWGMPSVTSSQMMHSRWVAGRLILIFPLIKCVENVVK